MKKPNETVVVRQCLDFLALYGIFAWRVNNTGIYDPTRKVFRTFHGLKGVSDILGVLEPGGRFLAVECKRPGEKLKPAQEAFQSTVTAAGGLALVVTDVKELEAHLREEGFIP